MSKEKHAIVDLVWIEHLYADWRKGKQLTQQEQDMVFGFAYDGLVSQLPIHRIPVEVAFPQTVTECHAQISALCKLIQSMQSQIALTTGDQHV